MVPLLPKANHEEEASIKKVESDARPKIEAAAVKGADPKTAIGLATLSDSKPSKALPPSIVTKTTVAVPPAESKVAKLNVDTHDKTVESSSSTVARKPPAAAGLPVIPQKAVTKDRPSYEAPPLATNSSNYHQTTVRGDVSHNESPTVNKNAMPKSPVSKNSLKYKRHFDDKRSLDVALARARRAVKRQSDLTNGRKGGRFHQNGPNVGDTSDSSLIKLVNSTGIPTGGIQLGLNVIGKTSGVPKVCFYFHFFFFVISSHNTSTGCTAAQAYTGLLSNIQDLLSKGRSTSSFHS